MHQMIFVRIISTRALYLYTHIHSELACNADRTPRGIYCFLGTLSLT